jgi:hypothetical protein
MFLDGPNMALYVPLARSPPPASSRSSSPIPLRRIATNEALSVEEGFDPSEILDDHPLRSYPRECCPELKYYLLAWYSVAWRNWNDRIFRLVCVLLIAL